MDPYYFMKNLKINNNNKDVELHDICNCYPFGSWDIISEDGVHIIYENKKYSKITYDNDTKKINFIDLNNNLVKTLKLVLEQV